MWLLVSKTSDKTVENTDAGAAWTLLVHRTERLFQGKLPSGDFVLFFHSNWIYSLLISAHRFLDLQIYNKLVPLILTITIYVSRIQKDIPHTFNSC